VKIGRGGFGDVFAVPRRDSDVRYAIKTVHVSGHTSMAELHREIKMQRELDHPNIVRVYAAYENPARSKLYIVMELCTGGALYSRLQERNAGVFRESDAAKLMQTMLSAVLYCHKLGLVHRDLKLDNFLYESEAADAPLKLTDFGFATNAIGDDGHERLKGRMGTAAYMCAPARAEPAIS
jgi:serine/threonine protein kinase